MFEKLVSFTKKVADLADRPSMNSNELKAQFDAAPDEVRQYLNKLIDALKKTETGDSGAKNIGATAISGLTGNDVQSLLDDLASKTYQAIPDFKTPELLNGWTANSASYPVKYWKEKDGLVHFRLAISGGALGANNACMIFPAGYRPDSTELQVGHVDNGGTSEDVIFSISAIGNVQPIRPLPGNSLLILNGSFKAVN